MIKQFMFSKPQESGSGLPLTGWDYRKAVTISRATGAVTNYQLKILVGESSGATGEDVDCESHVLSTFADLRFTAADGTTLLDYWVESISGTTPNQLATVWVEFDSIGTGDTTFYMYYGNAGASSASSGANTFLFFDDFERGSNGDTVGGDWTEDTPHAHISTEQEYPGIASDTRSLKFEGTGYPTAHFSLSPSATQAVQWRFFKTETGAPYIGAHGNGTKRTILVIGPDEQVYYYNGSPVGTGYSITAAAWNHFEFTNFDWSAYTYDIWLNGVKITTSAPMDTYAEQNGEMMFLGCDTAGASTFVDNMIVRNFRAVEPAFGAWGAEEPPASGNGVMMALIFGDYFAQGGPGGGGGTMIAMIFS